MMRKAEAVVPAFEEVDSVDARVAPTGTLENLSQDEVDRLLDTSRGGLYPLYRRCSLAVLNSGGETDDARAIFEVSSWPLKTTTEFFGRLHLDG